MTRITGIFDDYEHAETAVDELRKEGVSDDEIGILKKKPEEESEHEKAKATGRGAAVGAGTGALMGIAAAAIPGVGPFITAGVLTSWIGATAGTITAGAAVGGAAGALSGVLQEHADFPEEEAQRYAKRVDEGGVLVVVEPKGVVEESQVLATLERNDAAVNQVQVA